MACHPALANEMREEEVDFHILNLIDELVQTDTEGLAADSTLTTLPVYEAMFDCNVIFKSKYGGICQF